MTAWWSLKEVGGKYSDVHYRQHVVSMWEVWSTTSVEPSGFITTVLGLVECGIIFRARRPVKCWPITYKFVLLFAPARMLAIL
jgi:hypothetical protein